MKRILSFTAILAVILMVTGCSSLGGGNTNQNVGKHASELSEPQKISLLQDGYPLTYGTKATGYTVQCHILPGEYNQVAIYNGHNARGLSRATQQAMMVQMADNDCNVMYRPVRDNSGAIVTVSPVTILNDAVAQEDMMRVMARTVTPAIFNGTGAVALRSAMGNDCGQGGCAPTFNVMSQAVNQNSSENQLGADVNVGTDACTAGNCEDAGPPEE